MEPIRSGALSNHRAGRCIDAVRPALSRWDLAQRGRRDRRPGAGRLVDRPGAHEWPLGIPSQASERAHPQANTSRPGHAVPRRAARYERRWSSYAIQQCCEAAADQLPPIETEHAVLVANAPPTDIDGYRHYRPALVDRIARERFGVAPIWAPIGPLVREAVAPEIPEGLREQDWVNIIDVDAWHTDRPWWQSDRPVIGRHSRPSPQKWPTDPKIIEAVYPVDGSASVRILGGADPVRDVLGYVPESWQVMPVRSRGSSRVPGAVGFLRLLPPSGLGGGLRAQHLGGDGQRSPGDPAPTLSSAVRRLGDLRRTSRGAVPREPALRRPFSV